MAVECSTCFFARSPPADSGLPPGTLKCNRDAPIINTNPPAATWPWPEVTPDFWCGDYSATDPNVYFKPFAGPAGAPGEMGDPGDDSRAQWVFSEAAPTAGDGEDGNIWFETSGGNARKIWLKANGLWFAQVAFP